MTNRAFLPILALAAGLALLLVFIPPQADSAASIPSINQPLLPDIQITVEQIIASGLSNPVQVTNAGDGTGRLFVVEQTGKIRLIKNEQLLPTAFLDLTSLIVCCGERGLLGLAFHPNYPTTPYFYVNYTRAVDGATVIARYTVSG